jgi:CheY-like chemotaxis protein
MARILVVIDHPMAAHEVGDSLKDFGFTVEHAPSSADALKILRQNPPNAVLLDLELPMLDAFALLQARARDPMLSQIPVVILTNTAEGRSAVRKFQPYATLQKPPDLLQVADAFRRLMGERPVRSRSGIYRRPPQTMR